MRPEAGPGVWGASARPSHPSGSSSCLLGLRIPPPTPHLRKPQTAAKQRSPRVSHPTSAPVPGLSAPPCPVQPGLSPGARPVYPTSAPLPGLSIHSEGACARLRESHCGPLSSAQSPARPCSASGTSRLASEGRAPPLAPWTGTDCWGGLESELLGRQGADPRLSPFTGPWSAELPLSPGVGGLGRLREGRGWALTCSSSSCWAAPRGPGM